MDYEKIRAFRNANNPFCRRLGIYVEELRAGYARAVMTTTEENQNPVGIPHGGIYFSLADTACGSAMAAYGTIAVTINSSLSFLRSAKTGDKLIAEARELPSGRTVCALEVRITGEAGELFAVGTFTFRRLDRNIDLESL